MYELIAIGAKTLGLMSIVGTDLIIKTAMSATTNLLSALSYLTNINQPGMETFKTEIDDISLEMYVNIVKLKLEELNKDELKLSAREMVKYVAISLENIHEELAIISSDISKHSELYFSSWRAFKCECNVDIIKKHQQQLKTRFELLLKLI